MYLLQQRNESCFLYSTINQNPRNHFSHLLFTNGNGIEFEDGNPVNFVYFNRTIPWTEYYKQVISFDFLKQYYMDRMYDNEVQESYNMYKSMYDHTSMDMHDSVLWDKSRTKIDNNISNIKELTLENITSSDFWYKTFFENNEYYPRLGLSNGYFKLQYFNSNTESILLSVALALVDAYIKFYISVLDGSEDMKAFKDSYGGLRSNEWSEKNLINAHKATEKDLSILKVEREKLISLMKQ